MDWQPRFCPTNSKLDKGYCCGRVEMRFTLTKLNSCSLSRRVEIGVVLQVQIEELSPRTLTALPETGITIEWATSWLGASRRWWSFPGCYSSLRAGLLERASQLGLQEKAWPLHVVLTYILGRRVALNLRGRASCSGTVFVCVLLVSVWRSSSQAP